MRALRWSQICFGGSEAPQEAPQKGTTCDRKTPSSSCAQSHPLSDCLSLITKLNTDVLPREHA